MTNSLKEKVTLAAIVKNERTNYAGGIDDFVRKNLPYLRGAIIADTGSTDGTYEILQALSKEFKSLQVIQLPFRGFGETRNMVLRKVTSPWVLSLDADERISDYEFSRLAVLFEKEQNAVDAFNFDYSTKDPIGNKIQAYQSNPRLFRNVKGLEYIGKSYESIKDIAKMLPREIDSGVTINHFIPPVQEYLAKHKKLRLT